MSKLIEFCNLFKFYTELFEKDYNHGKLNVIKIFSTMQEKGKRYFYEEDVL